MVRGFGKDGHAYYTFHIPKSRGCVTSYQDGGDWESKKHLDIGNCCVDLSVSLRTTGGGRVGIQCRNKCCWWGMVRVVETVA